MVGTLLETHVPCSSLRFIYRTAGLPPCSTKIVLSVVTEDFWPFLALLTLILTDFSMSSSTLYEDLFHSVFHNTLLFSFIGKTYQMMSFIIIIIWEKHCLLHSSFYILHLSVNNQNISSVMICYHQIFFFHHGTVVCFPDLILCFRPGAEITINSKTHIKFSRFSAFLVSYHHHLLHKPAEENHCLSGHFKQLIIL